jgi:hypothetical protein
MCGVPHELFVARRRSVSPIDNRQLDHSGELAPEGQRFIPVVEQADDNILTVACGELDLIRRLALRLAICRHREVIDFDTCEIR